MSSIRHKLYVEVGLQALVHSPADTKILCLQRLVRLLAYGSSSLILVLYLTCLGISEEMIGIFMTLTLLGDVVISLLLTAVADAVGRRKMLAFGSLLMVASGVIFATRSEYWLLVVASVLGVISPRYGPGHFTVGDRAD
jgi:MFS family permease